MAHDPIPHKPLRTGVTFEEAARNFHAIATALREQEIRNIIAFAGCNRERAERLRIWLHNDELVIGGLHRIEREGLTLGERLAKAFQPLAAIGRRYRS